MISYDNVVVAIDGSEESARILDKALSLVEGSGASVSVVVVYEVLIGQYARDVDITDFERVQQEYQEKVSRETRRRMAAKYPSIPADNIHFLQGRPAHEIKRFAKDCNADLVVIGSHGQGAVSAAVLGSTAIGVLHGSHCDVYTVRV